MNRKLITGWLLIALGLVQAGGGIMLAQAAAQGGSELADPNLVRIHVIAHSDAEADQALKLKVRDAVLDRLRPALLGASSRTAAEEVIRNLLGELEDVAAAVVAAQGSTYPVRAELGSFDFPGKAYDGLYLPAGRYRALRILIGDAAGANFWCLVYPSFCYTIREVQVPEAGPDQIPGAAGVSLDGIPQAAGSARTARPLVCECICPL